MLINAYPDCVPPSERAGTDVRVDAGRDFEINITIRGKLVGIVSFGDPSTGLADRLRGFIGKGCVVIVCSTRTFGATVVAVEEIRQLGFDIVFHKKQETDAAKHAAENLKLAEQVVGEIEAALA